VDSTVWYTLCGCEVSMSKEVFNPMKVQVLFQENPTHKDLEKRNRGNYKILRPMLKRGLRDAILDGSFYSVMTSLTNGVFLTGFALALGSSHFEIGVIASFPLLAPMLQLPASPLLARRRLKRICLWTSFLGRSVWVPIAFIPLIAMSSSLHTLVWVLIFGMAFYLGVHAFAMIKALSNIKRLSTMMGLQPLVHPSLIRSVKRRSP
jgi:hypothetical protein